jgi:hypothetical protein
MCVCIMRAHTHKLAYRHTLKMFRPPVVFPDLTPLEQRGTAIPIIIEGHETAFNGF